MRRAGFLVVLAFLAVAPAVSAEEPFQPTPDLLLNLRIEGARWFRYEDGKLAMRANAETIVWRSGERALEATGLVVEQTESEGERGAAMRGVSAPTALIFPEERLAILRGGASAVWEEGRIEADTARLEWDTQRATLDGPARITTTHIEGTIDSPTIDGKTGRIESGPVDLRARLVEGTR